MDIIFEDSSIIVVRKPAGMDSQRSGGFSADMESSIRNYLAEKAGKPNPYVAVIHRLDRPVAGVMVYAKNRKAAAELSRQLREREFTKFYEALVVGELKEKSGKLEDYIEENKKNGLSCIAENCENARKAILTYQELEEGKARAEKIFSVFRKMLPDDGSVHCLEIHLETGRHHQIRVQTSGHGWPIAGDTRYGGPACPGVPGRAIALCAVRLEFCHPVNGKKMEFCW